MSVSTVANPQRFVNSINCFLWSTFDNAIVGHNDLSQATLSSGRSMRPSSLHRVVFQLILLGLGVFVAGLNVVAASCDIQAPAVGTKAGNFEHSPENFAAVKNGVWQPVGAESETHALRTSEPVNSSADNETESERLHEGSVVAIERRLPFGRFAIVKTSAVCFGLPTLCEMGIRLQI
ncbi:hypothetical protein CGZ80_15995 [Rhodopirellula sp. MGV]|nr:hypothetical protein CGZ80_15995 [Rhodopirellula sp. MGV]PNY33593.1 hypothetical protein C2E31_27720 [Rhodopirellula baltica]